jgi:cytidylate kinase
MVKLISANVIKIYEIQQLKCALPLVLLRVMCFFIEKSLCLSGLLRIFVIIYIVYNMDDKKYVITIGRQFGSGGRELGKLLARKLGIAYYDKELLCEAAKKAGVSPEFFEKSDEKFPKFFNGLFSFTMGYNPYTLYSGSTSISDDSLYRAQSDFIHSVADTHPCVIVGRSADYILRDHPLCVNVFVHAPMDVCIERIMKRGDKTTREQAKALAEKTNKLRAGYYNFYTDKTWGDAKSYHLTIDSSSMTMDDIAEVICDYLRRRIKNVCERGL